jgi:uncharacterized membrane protein YfcA
VDLLDWAWLAATTAGAALLYTLTGFGFAVLAAPLFLLFVDPQGAIQLVIIISTALSLVTLPGLWRAIVPGLLLRLGLGSLAGLPLGLVAFRHADPIVVRALVGGTILVFAILLEWRRRHSAGELSAPFAVRPGLEVATGAVSGVATALVGMAGPPVLIYLLLAGAPPRTVRATLLSFFALAYAASVATHALTIGIQTETWVSAGILIPFAFLGGLAGRPIGDRLHADAFAILATLLLGGAGLYTLATAVKLAVR